MAADNSVILYNLDDIDEDRPQRTASFMNDVVLPVGNFDAMQVTGEGTAARVTVKDTTYLFVKDGGMVSGVTVEYGSVIGGGVFELGNGTAETVQVNGTLRVLNGGSVRNLTVGAHGSAVVRDGRASGVRVQANGAISITKGVVDGVTIAAGGMLQTNSREVVVQDLTMEKGSVVQLAAGTRLFGSIHVQSMLFLQGDIDAGEATLYFDLSGLKPEESVFLSHWSRYHGDSLVITLSAEQASGTYLLVAYAQGAEATITVQGEDGTAIGVCHSGTLLYSGDRFYSLHTDGISLVFTLGTVTTVVLGDSAGHSDVQLTAADGAVSVYATDAVLPQRSVMRKAGAAEWQAATVDRKSVDGAACLISLVKDDVPDIVYATPAGTWSSAYVAQNTLSGEASVSIAGRNRFDLRAVGSDDPSLLLLTDDAAGDAFFAEDLYSALGGKLRLEHLQEVRAGAGDDLIDMTARRLRNANPGLVIRGGAGDDILWAAGDGGRLFGDSGDDVLTGGGGNDILSGGSGNDALCGLGGSNIYAFGENWGQDTVQLTSGEDFRFWFATGISREDVVLSYGEQGTATLICGDDCIEVSGLSEKTLSERLLFGEADGAVFADCDYAMLEELGAFDGDSSSRVFFAIR